MLSWVKASNQLTYDVISLILVQGLSRESNIPNQDIAVVAVDRHGVRR